MSLDKKPVHASGRANKVQKKGPVIILNEKFEGMIDEMKGHVYDWKVARSNSDQYDETRDHQENRFICHEGIQIGRRNGY